MELPYTKSVQEVLEHYKVTEHEGLSEDRIEQQRNIYGLNGKLYTESLLW